MSNYYGRPPRSAGAENAMAAFGCLWLIFCVAWVGFIGFMIYLVVTWLVTK